MYNGLITACDACGKVLRGRVGTAEMHHRFVEVSGTIRVYGDQIDVKDMSKSVRKKNSRIRSYFTIKSISNKLGDSPFSVCTDSASIHAFPCGPPLHLLKFAVFPGNPPQLGLGSH